MTSRLREIPRPVLAGALVFLMAFGIFGATTSQLPGYEPETAAVTAGLVEEGHFWGVEDPELPTLITYLPGKGGHLYARAGLLQPLLEAPAFAAGKFVDDNFNWSGPYPYRLLFLWFFNPFMAALAAVALFALVYLARRSLGWAATIAALFVFASVTWPYAKIGMETTFMATVLAAFALAVWARRTRTPLAWGLTGFAAGASAATKPYSVIVILPLAILLWPTWWGLNRRDRLRLLTPAALPVIAWGIVIAWYNWSRFGSPTDFGYTESSLTLSMPLNVIGMIFSPGKGLIVYSPLVILGALGVPRLWRADRELALSLLTLLALLTLISGASTYWGDEVWGPRYLVPAAWTLLVPIAWWCDTRVRTRVLYGFTALAALVAFVGATGYYGQYVPIVQKLTGVPLYEDRFAGLNPEEIPYGDDPTRWIPELSPVLLQTEGLLSSQVLERVGVGALTVTYHPFEGRSRSLDFSQPEFRIAPDYFWHLLVPTTAARLLALMLASMSLASGYGLYRMTRARGASSLASTG